MTAKDVCVRCGVGGSASDAMSLSAGEFAVCRDCLDRLGPARERVRFCPADGSAMRTESARQQVMIDRCPACGGVWLDRREIEVLLRLSRAAADEKLAEGMLLGMLLG